jgi:hypothetical protein
MATTRRPALLQGPVSFLIVNGIVTSSRRLS